MAATDTLAQMLSIIRNGQMALHPTVSFAASNLRANVLEVLKKEGFINDYSKETNAEGKPVLKVELKYFEGKPAIKVLKRISTPGRRVYSSISHLPKFYNGLGIAILSTPKGVMSDYEARIANVGGEVLCNVF